MILRKFYNWMESIRWKLKKENLNPNFWEKKHVQTRFYGFRILVLNLGYKNLNESCNNFPGFQKSDRI